MKKEGHILKSLDLKMRTTKAIFIRSNVIYQNMKALCLITVKPGKVDTVVEILKKKRKIIKNVMIVTGRADVTAVLNGNIDEINNTVIDFKKIKEIVTTETLIEVEVNMGW